MQHTLPALVFDLDGTLADTAGDLHLVLQEVLADPTSPYAGKVVGIANGQVVLVGDDLSTTHRRLLEIEPNTWRCATFEPSRPPEHV